MGEGVGVVGEGVGLVDVRGCLSADEESGGSGDWQLDSAARSASGSYSISIRL